ncbi:MAG: hypothetical protein R6V62_02800 [Candidatus Fermentibacteraceae bacterium]
MRRADTLLAVSGLSLFAVLLSVSAYLLNWRVVNEPGARPVPGLFAAFRILSIAGLSGALLSNGTLLLLRTRPLRILLVPPGVAIVLYLPVLALTLIMLV